jgi:outer membrane immunogenic protein
MRNILAATVALLIPGSAFAADLPLPSLYKAPPAPVYVFSWTGAYAGVNAGYGTQNTQTQYSYSSIPAPAFPGFNDVFGPGGMLGLTGPSAVANALGVGFLPASMGNSAAGFFTVGGQIGYNWQFGRYVLGAETDFERGGGSKTSSFVAPPNGIITNSDTSTAGLAWLGTARARVGYAFDRTLFFATGGLAYGRVTASTPTASPGTYRGYEPVTRSAAASNMPSPTT